MNDTATTPDSAASEPAGPAPAGAGPPWTRALANRGVQRSLTVFAFLVIFAIYGVWLGELFLNVDARLLDVHQYVPVLILGLAVLVTLVTGLFDLSVASMATLTAFMTIGLTTNQGWPFGLVILACLAIGLIGGLINGLLVEVLRVNTFIATLGTSGVFVGLSTAYSDGTQVTVQAGAPGPPDWFGELGAFGTKAPEWVLTAAAVIAAYALFVTLDRLRPQRLHGRQWLVARLGLVVIAALLLVLVFDLRDWIAGSSWLIALLLLVALVVWTLVQFTTYGRHLRSIGSNRSAARLAGVRVEREVVKAFMIGGFLSALAGIVVAASQGSASPDVAGSFLLPAFAAAFLSTVVLSAGHFTVWGTLVGGSFLVWVSQGLIIGGMPATWTAVVNGFVLIVAVAFSTGMRRSSR